MIGDGGGRTALMGGILGGIPTLYRVIVNFAIVSISNFIMQVTLNREFWFD
jgi:hypothetical protein